MRGKRLRVQLPIRLLLWISVMEAMSGTMAYRDAGGGTPCLAAAGVMHNDNTWGIKFLTTWMFTTYACSAPADDDG